MDTKPILLFSPVVLATELPLVREIGPQGPAVLNTRLIGPVLILDKLVGRLELRYGAGEQAQVIRVTRGTLADDYVPWGRAMPGVSCTDRGRLLMATYSVQRPPFQVTRLRRSVFIIPAILGLLLLGGLFWLLASPKARDEVSKIQDAGNWPGWLKQATAYTPTKQATAPATVERDLVAEELAKIRAATAGATTRP